MSAAPTPAVLPRLPDGPHTPDRSTPLAFVLLLPSKSGAVFLQRGRSVVLPVFTGWDQAAAFLVAARMTRCWIKELPSEEAVAEFLGNPPGRTGAATDLQVAVDPADSMSLSANLFPARKVIDALRVDYH
jgi:hypothetical protein